MGKKPEFVKKRPDRKNEREASDPRLLETVVDPIIVSRDSQAPTMSIEPPRNWYVEKKNFFFGNLCVDKLRSLQCAFQKHFATTHYCYILHILFNNIPQEL